MYIILVDWKYSKGFFLERFFESKSISFKVFDIPDYKTEERNTKIGGFKIYLKYIKLAYKAVKASNKNDDVIICWNFTTSIAVGCVCKILNKNRKIIGLNIIAPPLKGIMEPLRNKLFNYVMKIDSFLVTVNSAEYIDEYSNRFNISNTKFKVLHDPFDSSSVLSHFKPLRSYVFCGGEAHRDWKTLFCAAKLTPEIPFICIAREKYFDKSIKVPDNVHLLFDVDYSVFYTKMQEATLVVIPLNSILPAGLIILLKAAAYAKPVIATNTPAIRNYIEDNNTGLLVEQSDSILLAEKIKTAYNDLQLQEKLATNLQNYLLLKHSEVSYSNCLTSIIEHNL